MFFMTDSLNWPFLISRLLENENLGVSQAKWAMGEIMKGDATPAQISAFLIALKVKGETVDEIVGFREAILAAAHPINLKPDALDIVGTGGDVHGTVNVSTMSSIVAAAAGVPVIKHGNRAATSKSGASDVLQALGVNIDIDMAKIEQIFDELSIAFIWASKFHPGFAHAGVVRREIGVPTVFNMLGPLCNPVRPIASAVGVADEQRAALISRVFAIRGASALVFRGDDGLDELSTTGHSHIWEISQGSISEHDLNPIELGLEVVEIDALKGGEAAENAEIALRALGGELGAVRDVVLLNAAAGMVAYDLAKDAEQSELPIRKRIAERMDSAREAIDSGAALNLLNNWIAATNS